MDPVQMRIKNSSFEHHAQILEVWEKSVRASHHFLNIQQIDQIKILITQHDYFSHVQLFHIELNQQIIAFTGLAYEKIEMLFVDPQYFGQGLGTKLIQHAFSLGVNAVDVNQRNPQALGFYQKHGFQQIARSELDAEGRPFPILHLKRKNDEIYNLENQVLQQKLQPCYSIDH